VDGPVARIDARPGRIDSDATGARPTWTGGVGGKRRGVVDAVGRLDDVAAADALPVGHEVHGGHMGGWVGVRAHPLAIRPRPAPLTVAPRPSAVTGDE